MKYIKFLLRLSKSRKRLPIGVGLTFGDFSLLHPPVKPVYIMKRTNIVLNEKLVRQGLKATGIKTRHALVNHALTELVRREKQTGLLALKGRVAWDGNLDAMHRTRTS